MAEKFLKKEILAPAGSAECVKAAVRCGADAIYLGTKDFNARRNAENFDFSDLKEIIEYCHARSVKVHVTLNTLIRDDEMAQAVKVVQHVCRLGADVLILQDLGLSEIVRQCSEIECHASTQMSVQTPYGLKLLEKMGFTTAVVPREASRQEIEYLSKNTMLTLEGFVHGALCMCVSGQCYLSAALGGRSGNRGMCAQPCRLAFSAGDSGRRDLSLKDLSLIEKANEMSRAGVQSFKIEGRMKRPEYVAAAVTALKNKFSGTEDGEVSSALSAVFSRSGFTDGYFESRLGSDMFGFRTKEDVTASTNKVMSFLQRLYDRETPRRTVDFYFTAVCGEKVSLSASCAGKSVFVTDSSEPQTALNKPTTAEAVRERLSKCGGTMFAAGEVEVELDDGVMIPASVINSLRRTALEKIEKELSIVKPVRFTEPNLEHLPHKASGEVKYDVRVDSISQIPENTNNVENLIIPLSDVKKYVESNKNTGISVLVEVPRGIFGTAENILQQLIKAKSYGIDGAYCSTIDAVMLAEKAGLDVYGGFGLNVFNSYSVGVLEKLGVKSITLSPELTLAQAERIGGSARRSIIAYGRLPLMLTRNCPIKNVKSCTECKRSSSLTDRMNIKFPVRCTNGFSEILNSRPIYLGDRLNEIKNIDSLTFYFTTERKELVEAVLDAYRKGKGVKGEFTRGLYYRGVE